MKYERLRNIKIELTENEKNKLKSMDNVLQLPTYLLLIEVSLLLSAFK